MSNTLKPDLLWIEGRCYRVNDSTTQVTSFQEQDLYGNETPFNEIENEDDDNDDFEITMLDDTRYSTSFHVSQHYLGCIIGKKGATKSRIERDTKTQIKIPRYKGDISITGPTASNVKAARRKINTIVVSSRMKQRATHFISLPVNSQDITTNFSKFKSVLKECTSRGVEESLFQIPAKLHLTVGVMCLMDNEERLIASKLLTEAKTSIIIPMLQGHIPLKLRMKGLSYMNDDPQQIHILYACVQDEGSTSGLLQNLADALVQHFNKAGFMKIEFERENVKLHVTVMNSRYRGRSTKDGGGDVSPTATKGRTPFDGTDILDKFGDYDFGVAVINDIHLSTLNTIGSDGYYVPTCVVNCQTDS